MKNFIARTITGILFVAAVVVSFLDPVAMIALFCLVTGLTVWEFTGLVNRRDDVSVKSCMPSSQTRYTTGLTP